MDVHSYWGRFLLLAVALLALLAAMWAALLRLNLQIPDLQANLALSHGPLMICGFLGTLISLERSVALKRWWAYLAPLLTALGAIALIAGVPGAAGPLLIVLGSLALICDFAVILRRQMAVFTITMALGAVAWMIGNVLWLSGIPISLMVHWWAGFLILTIVGERLELSRLTSQSRTAVRWFAFSAGLFLAGLVWASLDRTRGLELGGAGILALALWLARFDAARRTVRLHGLPRFVAVHLLTGYFWLAVGALFWMLTGWFSNYDWQAFHYDGMLHSIFLGFVFSMIFAHAPIIIPAVTGRPLVFRNFLYAHGLLLHISVALRIYSDLMGQFIPYRWSGILNVAAVLIFLASTGYSLRSSTPKRQFAARSPALR